MSRTRATPDTMASSCPSKLPVEKRALISLLEAEKLGRTFKVLSNATRLRLLHALIRRPELCVTDLAKAIGMKPQAVSNQLQRLVDRGILGSKRNGNTVCYRMIDPCVRSLLDQGLCLTEEAEGRATRLQRADLPRR